MDKKEKTRGTIARSGLVVSSMTLLSRIGGFVRDIFLSHLFGASQLADMFFVALRIPNFFRRMFAEGAFSQAFVPVMMRYKDQGLLELRDFLSSLSGIFLLGLLAFTFLGLLFPEAITALFAPGFLDKPSVFKETALLVRITFPYLALISMTAYSASLLNAHGRFAIPAITPIVLNICLIVAALLSTYLFLDYSSAFVLSYGVLIAGFLQLSLQLPLLVKLRLIPKPTLNTKHPGIRRVGALFVPALFAASVNQINTLVNTILASTLITGSISWLYYADRLLELPIGLVAVALGTVLLPYLSSIAIEDDKAKYSAAIDWGVHLGLVLALPAASALFALAIPLILVVFMSFGGAMSSDDALMAGSALKMFSFALPAFVLIKVFSPAFFAKEDTKTPFLCAICAVVVNLVIGLSTYRSMGHVGLAMATAFSSWTNALLLMVNLVRMDHYQPAVSLLSGLAKSLTATALLLLAWYYILPDEISWLNIDPLDRVFLLLVVIGLSVVSYAAFLAILGVRFRRLIDPREESTS